MRTANIESGLENLFSLKRVRFREVSLCAVSYPSMNFLASLVCVYCRYYWDLGICTLYPLQPDSV